NPARLSTPCLVLPVFESGQLPEPTASLDAQLRKTFSKLLAAGDIAGKIGDVLLLQKLEGLSAQRVLLVGCGKASELNGKKYVQVIRHASKALVKHGQFTAAAALLDLPVKDEDTRHL